MAAVIVIEMTGKAGEIDKAPPRISEGLKEVATADDTEECAADAAPGCGDDNPSR
ncbi:MULTISPECIES: hypothetical protein [Streptomyces]|uniref:hypothetical protein n=1 Tax=Streptomyces TaxID=1883 RepID=UPI000A7EA537|nr:MULTISPECIES: hypothetical protein [unclassified Streptomyces]